MGLKSVSGSFNSKLMPFLFHYLCFKMYICSMREEKKVGRPKAASDVKKKNRVVLLLDDTEYKNLQKLSVGFCSVNDFIRTRLFTNSTLQQVQPEVFLATLDKLVAELESAKTEVQNAVKLTMRSTETATKDLNVQLVSVFRKLLKQEKRIADYMFRMLKEGRKTGV